MHRNVWFSHFCSSICDGIGSSSSRAWNNLRMVHRSTYTRERRRPLSLVLGGLCIAALPHLVDDGTVLSEKHE